MCHSNKLESVFECEVSRLLYDEGEVEYWMYEPVDLTEQSATNAATGSTMQGDLTECSVCFDFKCQLGKNISPPPPLNFFAGIPANPKKDHHWVKTKSTKRMFCQEIFNLMPRFFLHHQIDLAQRDGKKILLSMINAVSRILCLDFDFPENYTHINQVLNSHSLTFESFFVLVFHLCLATNILLCFVRCTNWIANESDEMVQEIVYSHTYHPCSLLRLFTWSTGLLRTLLYTDDLEKSNEMITHCVDHVREFYDLKNAAATPVKPPNAHLFLGADNASSQAKNNYHFAWMVDYIEEDHGLQTIQQNFTAEQHGKGTFFPSEISQHGLLVT